MTNNNGKNGMVRAIALTIAAGLAATLTPSAVAQGRLFDASVRSVPVSADAVRVVSGSLNLQPGDADVFGRVAQVRQQFESVAGRYEFSGSMQVRLAADASRERAVSRIAPITGERFEDVGQFVIDLPAGVDENTFAELLMATGEYEWVEPDYTVFLAATPNDPSFGWQHTRIQSTAAWDIETGSSSVVVAVVDSGVDPDHPDLEAAMIEGFNSVSNLSESQGGETSDINGHGTFCSGLAAAIGNNGTGTAGVGWNFSLMPIRASFNNAGDASLSDLQQGARWAADNGADVVNVSFSGIEQLSWNSTGDYAKQRGALIFHAAGNDSRQLGGNEYEHVVVVGSTTSSDNKSGFSNTGDLVSLTAPGSSVFSTRNGGGYGNSSGTSFAAPVAAGVGALIFSVNPEFGAADVQEILYDSLDDLGAPGKDDLFGRGRVNSFLAVTNAQTFVPRLDSPFNDPFDISGPASDIWDQVVGATAVEPDFAAASDGFATLLDGDSLLVSRPLRLQEASSSSRPLSVVLTAADRGVEAGEALVIEYDNGTGWQEFFSITGNGLQRDAFVTYEVVLPEDTFVSGTVLRARPNNADADDAWYLDSFDVTEVTRNEIRALPVLETFEAPLDLNPRIEEFESASVVAPAGGAPGGGKAVAITNGGDVEFERLATLDPDNIFNPADLRFDWATEGVPAGTRLFLEYEPTEDFWTEVVSVVADGQGGFKTFDGEITFVGLGDVVSYRFRPESTEGTWFVDELWMARGDDYPTLAVDSDGPCGPADLALPFGVLDLADVDGFIAAFVVGDAAADLSAPLGVVDLADIDTFIGSFLAGCP